jgi:hypothetical protein
LKVPSRVERTAARMELVRAEGMAVQMVGMRVQMRADSKAAMKADLTGVSTADPKVSWRVELLEQMWVEQTAPPMAESTVDLMVVYWAAMTEQMTDDSTAEWTAQMSAEQLGRSKAVR